MSRIACGCTVVLGHEAALVSYSGRRRRLEPVAQPRRHLRMVPLAGGDGPRPRAASSMSGWARQVQPLISRNTRIVTQAARLLPSGRGWFFARWTISTAALSMRSG